MQNSVVIPIILLMALVTMLPRVLPILLFAGREMPPLVDRWLKFVPAALLAAVLTQEVLFRGEHLNLHWRNFSLWALIPTFWIAHRSRNLALTVVTGVVCLAFFRWVGGTV
jgi:branched-subunit amino acid transport protein